MNPLNATRLYHVWADWSPVDASVTTLHQLLGTYTTFGQARDAAIAQCRFHDPDGTRTVTVNRVRWQGTHEFSAIIRTDHQNPALARLDIWVDVQILDQPTHY